MRRTSSGVSSSGRPARRSSAAPRRRRCASTHGERGHVDDAARGHRRRQDVRRLRRAEQDRADVTAVGRRLQQVEGDVGRVEVGMTSRFASPLSRELGKTLVRGSPARARRRPASRRRPRGRARAGAGSRQRLAHLARRGLVASCRSCECDSSATFGSMPKRRTSSAASSVISAICSAVGIGVDIGVADEQRAARQDQQAERRRSACALGPQADDVADVVADGCGTGR